jgi:SIT4-associating protein SAP185/190
VELIFFQDDELWPPVRSTGVPGDNNDDNPFGHDTFKPTVRPPLASPSSDPFADPLTPHDHFLQEFDREFEPAEGSGPAIVVPDLDDDEGKDIGESRLGRGRIPSAGGSSWSFDGDDEGEDLPPTISPTTEDIDRFAGLSLGPSLSRVEANHSPDPSSPVGLTEGLPIPTQSNENPASSPLTIPSRHPLPDTTSPRVSPTKPRTRSIDEGTSEEMGISPPDSSLVSAASDNEPLGPGVNSDDTRITSDGMVEKEVDGGFVKVPADEIVRGVDDRRRGSSDLGS